MAVCVRISALLNVRPSLNTRSAQYLRPICAQETRRLQKPIELNVSEQRRTFASRVIIEETLGKQILRQIRSLLRRPKMKVPPYDHICQVGDPILRGQSSPVDPRQIKSAEIQNVIRTMVKQMRKVRAVGCAAPQVGVAKQIIVMELTKRHLKWFDEEVLKARECKVFPLKVFINPQVKVVDPRVVTFLEGCMSLCGYDACVPRAYGVQITGLNEKGEEVSWRTTGYAARIIQHEVDHLRGKLFIDTMDPLTFLDKEWPKWNIK
ncbi:peptide deformylase, mitochondrial-like [Asterias rubens]|uniref:peptide deformylase, mitochondrial-like n=1 Tax=Asterias rubens TaxID=7604 RepID=UPI0014551236|nr:peptide deformylase, mitochondrial-like [Asterias rubens]XP_033646938.1 peptide deformylase, mitochondrial-like [Asterias rubens]XP_033646939.1 peptide deformylase, mitochondrial-like [Asterias rubens]XP_033646940.1 peptide deformylase, mitochondrial-like [Asterias rubens]XP_033646941.1 peptide deformylase, mitochondrial-like [Asterias rubens]